MNDLEFANPELLYLFVILPLLVLWYFFKHKKQNAEIIISNTESIKKTGTLIVKSRHFLFILRLIVISLLIIIIARPQTSSSKKNVHTEGIDIVLCIDISTSMLAQDFKPNRLEVAKKTAMDFIDKRINDRIGLVVFAGESYTQSPVTIDHDVLKNLFTEIKTGLLVDGTAIGMGLATAINRLKDLKSKSKVVILLTDGVNNSGAISPLTAAQLASSFNIRVYTIGIGKHGFAPYPVQTPWGMRTQKMKVEIDENLLKEIANETGGKYFRATNKKSLQSIYNEIDKMERTKIDVSVFTKKTEEFLPFAIAAISLFLLELLLRFFLFRIIP